MLLEKLILILYIAIGCMFALNFVKGQPDDAIVDDDLSDRIRYDNTFIIITMTIITIFWPIYGVYKLFTMFYEKKKNS